MSFVSPMIWSEPSNHIDDCYYCLMPSLVGLSKKKALQLQYPVVRSVTRPVIRSSIDSSVASSPLPSSSVAEDDAEEAMSVDDDSPDDDDADEDYVPDEETGEPKLCTTAFLNDLCRDLKLSKDESMVLVSRLKERNLVEESVRISAHRDRDLPYSTFFDEADGLIYCSDSAGLINSMGISYNPEDWRLFIDSGKNSLKATLLHNENKHPAVPIGYSHSLGESYESMKLLLDCINYSQHLWVICADLKVITIILGLQGGFTKFMCYWCLWNSRAYELHFLRREWDIRPPPVVGRYNQLAEPLVSPSKCHIPPLHTRLGLATKFIKAMDQSGPAFAYMQEKFPGISTAKLENGVIVGPQIRQLLDDETFLELLVGAERIAWQSFKAFSEGFLGNHRAENFEELAEHMIDSFHQMGITMSYKLHLVDAHLDHFAPDCGKFSDEHGERFHQEISECERRWSGRWSKRMLGDFIWSRMRDEPDAIHKRQSKTIHVL